MAAPVEQVGVIIACDGCGQEVLQKTMIPMSVLDKVITYRCVACARKEVMTTTLRRNDLPASDLRRTPEQPQLLRSDDEGRGAEFGGVTSRERTDPGSARSAMITT